MPPWAPSGGPSKRRGTMMGESTSPAPRKVRTRRPMSWLGPQPKHWWKRLPGSGEQISAREAETNSNGAGRAGSCLPGALSNGTGRPEVFLEKRGPGAEGARGLAQLFRAVIPAPETEGVDPPWMGGRACRFLGRHDSALEGQGVLRSLGEGVVVAGVGGAEIAFGIGMRADEEGDALRHIGNDEIRAGLVVAARRFGPRARLLQRVADSLLGDGIAAHVVEKAREHDLLVRARAVGQLGALQRMGKLVDPLASVLPRRGLRHRLDQPVRHGGHGPRVYSALRPVTYPRRSAFRRTLGRSTKRHAFTSRLKPPASGQLPPHIVRALHALEVSGSIASADRRHRSWPSTSRVPRAMAAPPMMTRSTLSPAPPSVPARSGPREMAESTPTR